MNRRRVRDTADTLYVNCHAIVRWEMPGETADPIKAYLEATALAKHLGGAADAWIAARRAELKAAA